MSDTPQAQATPVSVEAGDRAIVATVRVKLMDDDILKALTQQVDQAAAAHPGVPLVLLDLAAVQIVPSIALGLLVQISNKCKVRQQKLKLVGVQPRVRQVFSITKLDRAFQFADSVESAIE